MIAIVINYVNIFPRFQRVRQCEALTMAETLIEEGERPTTERPERQVIVRQVTPDFPIHLKLLLASTIVLVVLVLGTIVYFIYAKYANE